MEADSGSGKQVPFSWPCSLNLVAPGEQKQGPEEGICSPWLLSQLNPAPHPAASPQPLAGAWQEKPWGSLPAPVSAEDSCGTRWAHPSCTCFLPSLPRCFPPAKGLQQDLLVLVVPDMASVPHTSATAAVAWVWVQALAPVVQEGASLTLIADPSSHTAQTPHSLQSCAPQMELIEFMPCLPLP